MAVQKPRPPLCACLSGQPVLLPASALPGITLTPGGGAPHPWVTVLQGVMSACVQLGLKCLGCPRGGSLPLQDCPGMGRGVWHLVLPWLSVTLHLEHPPYSQPGSSQERRLGRSKAEGLFL